MNTANLKIIKTEQGNHTIWIIRDQYGRIIKYYGHYEPNVLAQLN